MARTPDDPAKAQAWLVQNGPQVGIELYVPRGNKGDPGGLVSTTLPQGTNLNEIVTAGLYAVTSGTTAESALANLPIAISGSLFVTYSQGTTIQIQTYVTNTQAIYVRRRFAGNWNSWRAFTSQRVDQTAGRAIYTWDDVNGRDQLVYGDTGLRVLSMDNGFLGALNIRREGYGVTLTGSVRRPPAGSLNGIFLATIPAGFQPQAVAWTFFPVRHNGSSAYFTLYRRNTELMFEGATADTDASECRFEINWRTAQPWPTTLPGTASGTIPSL